MSVKIFDTMTTATPNFPLAYADKINVKLQDGSESDIQSLFTNGELGGGDSSVTITEQEYQALTDEEKYNGLYYCYDVGKIYKNGVEYARSPIVTVTETEDGHNVDIEDVSGVQSFEIPNGKNAVQFTPSITENGELAWENDGDLENPPTTPIQTIISNAPLGTVLSFAGSNAPNGYLLCDGTSYAVADYPHLYAVIGNTYGGDTENFNVPNLVDKFIQGSTASGTEKEAGLPNIEGALVSLNAGTSNFKDTEFVNGAFSAKTKWNAINGSGNMDSYGEVSFDASLSNPIYGNSDTVQPPALTMVYIIKAFHTNEGQDEGLSDDVINYVEGEIAEVDTELNAKLNGKANKSYVDDNFATMDKVNALHKQTTGFITGSLLGSVVKDANLYYQKFGDNRLVVNGWVSVDAVSARTPIFTLPNNWKANSNYLLPCYVIDSNVACACLIDINQGTVNSYTPLPATLELRFCAEIYVI